MMGTAAFTGRSAGKQKYGRHGQQDVSYHSACNYDANVDKTAIINAL
jgi:hypothetical protein